MNTFTDLPTYNLTTNYPSTIHTNTHLSSIYNSAAHFPSVHDENNENIYYPTIPHPATHPPLPHNTTTMIPFYNTMNFTVRPPPYDANIHPSSLYNTNTHFPMYNSNTQSYFDNFTN